LVISYLKGGLALKNVELRMAFFEGKSVGDIFVDREDFLFVERNTLRLSRIVQEAFTQMRSCQETCRQRSQFI
jgi:hypothetical protein